MSKATAQDSSKSTGSVELWRIHLDLPGLGGSRNHEVLGGGGVEIFRHRHRSGLKTSWGFRWMMTFEN